MPLLKKGCFFPPQTIQQLTIQTPPHSTPPHPTLRSPLTQPCLNPLSGSCYWCIFLLNAFYFLFLLYKIIIKFLILLLIIIITKFFFLIGGQFKHFIKKIIIQTKIKMHLIKSKVQILSPKLIFDYVNYFKIFSKK